MTKRLKKWTLAGGLLLFPLFLAGCMRVDSAGNPVGLFSTFLYNFVVIPTEYLVEWMAGLFGSYGWAIVALTIIVHLIILPISLKQKKSMMISQEKMQAIQPAINEIQEELKQTNNPQEKQYLQEELMEIYQQNDVNLMSSLAGCLPLLIQLPIFLGVFHVLQNSQNIANATFLGFRLGEPSLILGIIVGLAYYVQTKMMTASYPEDQRQQMKLMNLTMPLMIGFISVTSPAGLALYFLTGAIFVTIQTMLTNRIYEPVIQAELEERFGETKTVQRKEKPDFKDSTDQASDGLQADTDRIQAILEKNRQRNQEKRNR